MKRMSLGLLCIWLSLIFPMHAISAEQASVPSAATPRAIPFKQESQNLGSQLGQSLLLLLILVAIAAAILYAAKKYLPRFTPGGNTTGKRLQLVEVTRLTPKTTLFLVQFDESTLLLGQHGESFNLIAAHPSKAAPAALIQE